MKRLFLTGPSGCGKSTAIARALGEYMAGAGGFLTVRIRDAEGRAIAYRLQRPDSEEGEIFLDYSGRPAKMHLDVFEDLGVRLLEEAKRYPYIVLDEIGGVELLSPSFRQALDRILNSGIPCIGVMKGAAPASNMIRKLGLGEEYEQAAEELRCRMRRDGDTLLYECGQFDPEGLRLAREWVRTYAEKQGRSEAE